LRCASASRFVAKVPELLHAPAAGGGVVAALTHDPLAALPVDLGLADDPLHAEESCVPISYIGGYDQSTRHWHRL